MDAPALVTAAAAESAFQIVYGVGAVLAVCREIVCVVWCSFLSVVRWMDYLLCGAMGKKGASEQGDDATPASSRFHAFHSKDTPEKPAS